MTSAHILYIPTIFFLGFLAGSLSGNGYSHASTTKSGITPRMLIGSLVIFAIVFVGTHFFEIPRSSKSVTKALNGLEIFDKKPSYTSEEVYARMEMFPEYGRLLYKQFTYTIDVLFPITLFIFLFLLARFTVDKFRLAKAFQICLQIIPFTWMGMDFVENAIIFNLLDQYPAKNTFLAGSLGYITLLKFSLLLLSIITPITITTFHNIRKRVNVNS